MLRGSQPTLGGRHVDSLVRGVVCSCSLVFVMVKRFVEHLGRLDPEMNGFG
jgi:hypothetical protein